MPTRHGGSLPKNSITWPRLNCFLSTGLSEASTPCTWKTFLARSIPIVLICMWTAPSCDSSLTITLWHIDAGSGRRPPHQTGKPSESDCCPDPRLRRQQQLQADRVDPRRSVRRSRTTPEHPRLGSPFRVL